MLQAQQVWQQRRDLTQQQGDEVIAQIKSEVPDAVEAGRIFLQHLRQLHKLHIQLGELAPPMNDVKIPRYFGIENPTTPLLDVSRTSPLAGGPPRSGAAVAAVNVKVVNVGG